MICKAKLVKNIHFILIYFIKKKRIQGIKQPILVVLFLTWETNPKANKNVRIVCHSYANKCEPKNRLSVAMTSFQEKCIWRKLHN